MFAIIASFLLTTFQSALAQQGGGSGGSGSSGGTSSTSAGRAAGPSQSTFAQQPFSAGAPASGFAAPNTELEQAEPKLEVSLGEATAEFSDSSSTNASRAVARRENLMPRQVYGPVQLNHHFIPGRRVVTQTRAVIFGDRLVKVRGAMITEYSWPTRVKKPPFKFAGTRSSWQ